MQTSTFKLFTLGLLLAVCRLAIASETVEILHLPGTDGDPDKIDYAELPVLEGEHAVVSQATRNLEGVDKENPLPTDMLRRAILVHLERRTQGRRLADTRGAVRR